MRLPQDLNDLALEAVGAIGAHAPMLFVTEDGAQVQSGMCWVCGGPSPMFMTMYAFAGSIEVVVSNLLVTATQPASPEPIPWHGDAQQPLTLTTAASSAYKAVQPAELRIYSSDQALVKAIQSSPAIGPGTTALNYAWERLLTGL